MREHNPLDDTLVDALEGNGKPGVLERIRNLERRQDRLEKRAARAFWMSLVAIIALLLMSGATLSEVLQLGVSSVS